MSIRERVARALYQAEAPGGKWGREYASLRKAYKSEADAAITAFLEAAAEQGWRMVPGEATEEMQRVIVGRCKVPGRSYRVMLAKAPKFEVSK